MERALIKNLRENIGRPVLIKGWVDVRRDHGKLIFIDLRDSTGKIQCVAIPSHAEAHAEAGRLRSEWVVACEGIVNKRPEKMTTAAPNGDIELEMTSITVLNESETPPFNITGDTREINEDTRLEYRYLDLRNTRLQKNMHKRHEVTHFIRNYLKNRQFIEIETPLLTKSTPEGARDFLVPSRLERGNFYALPQSPQQYKQLLMVAGFERYFQFAKCLRDEDTRGDRQPEFTQLDLEMSFVSEEDIMGLNEGLLTALVEAVYPEKKIQQNPFPRIPYKEAIAKYGNDHPDLRKDKNDPKALAFCWIVDFPFFSAQGGPASGGENTKWTFTHNPFSMPKDEHIENVLQKKEIESVLASQYDIVLNGFEIGGGSIRAHKRNMLEAVLEIIGYGKKEAEEGFGHMFRAFSYGAPPHGGIAWGFDRLVMVLQNEPNIREVIAFPKTGEGKDLMMGAPSEVDKKQLDELGLQLAKTPKARKVKK